MKKLILILILTAFTLSAQEPIDTDGNGYRNISTLEQLRWVSENDSSWIWNFELDNDIDASDTKNWNDGKGFSPIGTEMISFTGKFIGNNYHIDSLFINRPNKDNIAIFGYTKYAEISNIEIIHCNITGNNDVGTLVGYNDKNSKIIRCNSSGIVSGNSKVGGLIGINNDYSDIINNSAKVDVNGIAYVGGLIGHNYYSTISNCFSLGDVKGNDNYVGGLVGENFHSVISNCYSQGALLGSDFIGGLVGRNYDYSIINNCYSTGYIVNNGDNIGGLVGSNALGTLVNNSFWNTETSGQIISDGGTGKSTQEMKTKVTYIEAGWNFDFIWKIDSNYPIISIDFSYRTKDSDNNGYINISTLSNLRWLSESGYDLDKNFELDNDIDASDTKNWNDTLGFNPIGNVSSPFRGKFEGNNFKIENLFINRSGQDNIALIGFCSESIIKDIVIINSNIKGNTHVGSLVGFSTKKSEILNCNSSGTVTGWFDVGGLVGSNNTNSSIKYSYNNCSVNGRKSVGGLLGKNFYQSTVSICYNCGVVKGNTEVGGLVGFDESKIMNCYNSGNVFGNDSIVGGLVGEIFMAEIENCYSTGSINGNETIGGLIGYIDDSYNDSDVYNSFWDIETSGHSTSDGGTGKPTSEMKTKSTFTDAEWDFEYIWSIDGVTNDGYPFLQMLDSIPSSVKEFIEKNENSIIIYPNPASDYIEISLDGADIQSGHHLNIEIYDVLGEFVSNVSTSVPSGHLRQRRTIRVDVSTLPKGVYFVKIGNNVEKFVKM